MKTLHVGMIVVFGFIIFFLSPSDSYASTCAVKETIYSAPQFFLLSDSVFAGTVTSITDYGNHQWQVHFDIEKIWKGVATRQTSTVMTGTLQACGYSIVVGEKYLIYTNGSPSFINPIDSKMYSDAQNEIALFDDPKFQSQEKVKEDLNKKLEIAQGRVGSMMMDKLCPIPISAVGVNQVNSTLDIVINDQKATLSLEQYRQSLQDILGDIPIKVEFGYATASAPILHSVNDQGQTIFYPITHGTNSSIVLKSPLKQFKSGIAANDVKCEQGLQLVIKAEDGSPTCVRSDTAIVLVEHRWATNVSQPNPMTGLNNDAGIATLENQAYYFETANYTDDAYHHPVQISFHDVIFTLFPSGFRGGLPAWGCGGSYYWTNTKFSDGTSELLQIFVGDQQCFVPQPSTHFSIHKNPQAGLTFYDGKMKLLVSANVIHSSGN